LKPIWIELVEKGVANRFEGETEEVIEVNWRLMMYPELYRRVLDHELGHEDGKFSVKDFKHDMFSKTPGLFSFMSKHISAWYQVIPIYWDRKRKQVVYDWSSIASWVLLFSTAYVIFIIMRWIL